MAQMGEEWPRWAGGGTKVTRLKLRRIKGLGPEPTSKSPHLAKNARYGAPGVEIVYARVQRKLLGRRCGLIVEADSLYFRGIYEPFPICWYCRAIRIAGRGLCGEPSCGADVDSGNSDSAQEFWWMGDAG